jgi:ATP-dependent Zn protease
VPTWSASRPTLATRNGATHVSIDDLNLAIERIVAGLEKKNRLLKEHERKVTSNQSPDAPFSAYNERSSEQR